MLFALDAMGGDNAPEAPCRGAILACEENPDISVALVGIRDKIDRYISDAES